MYDFSRHLFDNEKILYLGKPIPGKGSKAIGGFVFLICFVLLIQAIMIWSVVSEVGDGAVGVNYIFIIIFLVLTLFLFLGVYGIIYNLVLKKKQVDDDFYCLTNMRAMKYESKNDKLFFGYLAYYEEFYCSGVKDNIGDFYMGIIIDNKNYDDSAQKLIDIYDLISNPNPENMPFLNFQSIEHPYKVMDIAKQAKKVILENIEHQK